jgi:hypothetical protein
MNETTFWQMIEQAKIDSGGDGEEQVKLLVERLSLLEVGDIVEFGILHNTFHARAKRCDVWEAGIITDSVGDDGFVYFRGWLIAQGKDAYEQVLSDPDWLAQIITVEENEFWSIQLERMNYVSEYAYKRKTGSYENMPSIHVEEPDLAGEWTDDEELPQKYPNLWALFGDDTE